jgi:hypothetical protein
LKARDPKLDCLRGLLDHPVREVRTAATISESRLRMNGAATV